VEKTGHECLAAADGEEAWGLYKENPDLDVIISDWMMPGVDGLELCRRVRGDNRDGYTYFIFSRPSGTGSTSSRASRPGPTTTSQSPSTGTSSGCA
jgi:two-component system chemotaxis response regulator CheY